MPEVSAMMRGEVVSIKLCKFLTGMRNVRQAHLHLVHWQVSLHGIQAKYRPFGLPQFAGTHEKHRRNAARSG